MQGAGRTFFDLLRTLLDDHDEIIVFPFTDKFNSYWIKNNLNDSSSITTIVQKILYESKIRILAEKIHLNRGTRQDYSTIDWSLYEKHFRDFILKNKVSSRSVRLAIYYAFARTINKNLKKVKVIIADGYYSDYTDFILTDFPDAKFLHLLKDHRSNIYSLKEYYRKSLGTIYPIHGTQKNLFIHILVTSMTTNMKMLHQNNAKLGSRLKILKYEDVLSSPEKTMRNLSAWLGVRYDEILLNTTRIGKTSVSTSAFNEKGVTGINPGFAIRWRTELTSAEIRMIEFLFKNSMKALGYKKMYPDSFLNKIYGILACFLPWKGEILPHPDIKNKDKFKKTNFGRNRNSKWRFVKYYLFFVVNIIGFITSRILLCFLFFNRKFKSIV